MSSFQKHWSSKERECSTTETPSLGSATDDYWCLMSNGKHYTHFRTRTSQCVLNMNPSLLYCDLVSSRYQYFHMIRKIPNTEQHIKKRRQENINLFKSVDGRKTRTNTNGVDIYVSYAYKSLFHYNLQNKINYFNI